MKSNLKMFAAVPVLSLLLSAPLAMAQSGMSCSGPAISKSQAKALVTNAKTADDHHKLACFFRAQAKSEEGMAKYHEEMGKLYVNSSSPKHDMAAHCKKFAEEARMAAEADNQLAAEHDAIAAQAK